MNEEDLVKGAIYEVAALDFSVAIWTGEAFKGPKIEYGKLFFSLEQPYWNGLPFGTAKPIRRIGDYTIDKPFDGKNLLSVLEGLNQYVLEVRNEFGD